MEVQTKTKLVEILSADYQLTGSMEVIGNPGVFVNNPSYDVFVVHNASVTPLTVGTQVGKVSVPKLYVPKQEAQVILIDMTVEEAQLLPTKKPLVCFTDTYIIRGGFATGLETSAGDLFTAGQGPFFAAVQAEVLAMRPLTEEIGGSADLVYVRAEAVQAFYSSSGE
jgi:hypothetical protein